MLSILRDEAGRVGLGQVVVEGLECQAKHLKEALNEALAGAGEPVVCVQDHGDAAYDALSSLGPI